MKTFLCLLVGLLSAVTGWGFNFILDTGRGATGLPVKWDTPTIPVRVMADNSATLTDGNTRATAIVAAMTDPQRGWNQYLGTIQFVPQILPAGNGSDGNSINEVFFSSSPYGQAWEKNTLAITTVWAIGNQRSEADTIFNTSFTWDSYRGALRQNGVLDIERVALHELGHNLGLDHPDDNGQSVTAVMNSIVSNVDSLQADDIAGAQNLYGPPGVPANDNFANAIPITLSNSAATVTGFNTNATSEPGEPAHAGKAGSAIRSVWWKWTAPGAGGVTVDTTNSYFDTTMGVYIGTGVGALTVIGTNDDGPETAGSSTHNTSSTVTFTAVAGTVYYIAVNGFDNGDGTESGGITLNLSFAPVGGTLPTITTQPISLTSVAGLNVTFTVAATAGTQSDHPIGEFFNNAAISGATGTSLSLTNVQSANAGNYFVGVTTAAGTVNSNTVSLTVNPAMVVTPPPTTPTSSGGGGGGGAPSLWFYAALSLLGLGRRFFRSRIDR